MAQIPSPDAAKDAAKDAAGNPSQSPSLAGLEWPRLWQLLLDRLATPYGGATAGRAGFLDDVAAIRASMAIIGEAMEAMRAGTAMDFDGVHQLAPLLERVDKSGPLEARELLQVLTTQRAAVALAGLLGGRLDAPGLHALATGCQPEQGLLTTLGEALTPGGELNEQAYPELAKLRRELSRKREAIHKHLDAMLRSRALAPALQEKIHTLRGSRYVLPVKADFRGQVPGIVHDVSASGATLFIEPHAVVDESNALTMVEKQIEARQAEILAELSTAVGACSAALRSNTDWLGRVDLIHAQASLALDYGGATPQVEEGGEIALSQAANPLMVLEGADPVRNDFALGKQAHCMVISGANTGGKTVMLKTIGLCALLVRAGMPLPAAQGSRFDLFGDVRADIGDQQSMTQSLSTFSAQIRFMTETLAQGGPRSLVLIDEILTGTSPAEGAALAVTLLRVLADRGIRCIATSHYGELKELAAEHPGMLNASVAFDVRKLAPTYRLLSGTPGASYAFPIARRHGLEEALVNGARQQLEHRAATADALLTELHNQEQSLADREEALGKSELAASAARQNLEVREKDLGRQEWELKQRERGTISKELEAARRRIAEVIKELQGANSLPIVAKVRKKLDETSEALLTPLTPPEGAPAPLDPDTIQAGDEVLVRSLNQVAVLDDVNSRRKRATVRLGTLAMEVALAELSLPSRPSAQGKSNATGRRVRGGALAGTLAGTLSGSAPGARARMGKGTAGEPISFVLPTSENRLDLRGQRLEAALEKTEAFCDLGVVKHVSPLLLIHGHGTGKLKAGIRDWLAESGYVAAFRPGESGEGGDGVTVVALNL